MNINFSVDNFSKLFSGPARGNPKCANGYKRNCNDKKPSLFDARFVSKMQADSENCSHHHHIIMIIIAINLYTPMIQFCCVL